MKFRILGPLEVWRDGTSIALGKPRERALLAHLLLRANEVVGREELIRSLWGDDPPETAKAALHNAVSALRRALGEDVIETVAAGYRVRVEPADLDVLVFESLVREAREAPAAKRAELLAAALAHWRGLALAELPLAPSFQALIARLEEWRLLALEDRIDADLELGRHRELVPELESLVRLYATRERFWGQLMLALYGAGRQADALAAYRRAHAALVDELGIEPGPALRDLQRSILLQRPKLSGAGAAARPEVIERASALLPMDARARANALYDYAVASFRLGEWARADAILERALEEAVRARDPTLEELIALRLSWQRLSTSGGSLRAHLERAERAAQLFERLGDGAKLARSIQDQGRMLRDLGRADDAAAAFERVVELADASGDSWLAWFNRGAVCIALWLGSTPADQAIVRVEGVLADPDPVYGRQPAALHALGPLYAAVGRIPDARQVLDDAFAMCSEREEHTALAIGCFWRAYVERLAGDEAAEENALRAAVELAETASSSIPFGAARAELGRLLAAKNRLDEAEEHATVAQGSASADDFFVQARSRAALALVAARRGAAGDALALASEAVALTAETDWLTFRGAVLEDKAAVASGAGRTADAQASLSSALELYERKGNLAAAGLARERLARSV